MTTTSSPIEEEASCLSSSLPPLSLPLLAIRHCRQRQRPRYDHVRLMLFVLWGVSFWQGIPSSSSSSSSFFFCHAFGSNLPSAKPTATAGAATQSVNPSPTAATVRRKRLDYSNSPAIVVLGDDEITTTKTTSDSDTVLWEPLVLSEPPPLAAVSFFGQDTVQDKKRKGTFAKEKPVDRTYGKEEERWQLADRIAQLLRDDDDEDDDEEDSVNQVTAPAATSSPHEIADRKAVMSQLSEMDKSAAAFAVAADNDLLASPLQKHQQPQVRQSTTRSSSSSNKGGGKQMITAKVLETGQDTMKQYVKTLGAHQVLSRQDEVVLGQQVQLFMKWERIRQELEVEFGTRSPTFAEWAHAVNSTVPELKRQIRRSQKAKAALVEANFRLVVSVARQTIQLGRSETLNFQDACQEGILGLMRAVDKYDPTLGFRFSTYAIWWIKKMIHANLSQQGRQVRLPPNVLRKINDIRIQERVLRIELNRKPSDEEVAAKVGITLEQLYLYRNSANDIISLDKQVKVRNHKNGNHHGGDAPSLHALVQDTSTSTPTELVEHAMLREDVNQLIVSSNLHPREQAVIRLRFGIGTSINPQSLEEVAKKFKVDKEVIRSLETKAIRKLRQYRNMKSMKSYLQDL